MTDSVNLLHARTKDEIEPSCGECGCPPTALFAKDGEFFYRCGHCHEDAPMWCTEDPETHWPGGEPEFDDSIGEIMEELLWWK